MLKNYLVIALRIIIRDRGYTLINIAGLAVGLTGFILIFLWVQNELSYDDFHANKNYLYRVNHEWTKGDQTGNSALSSPLLAQALKSNFPELKHATRYHDKGKVFIKYDDKKTYDDKLAYADSDFFEMFSFPLVIGSADNVFTDNYSVVITEKMSRKYFGADNPIGKVLNIDRVDYTITGVLAEIPENTHFKFDCLVPFESMPEWLKNLLFKWEVSSFYTYVQLRDNAEPAFVTEKISRLVNEKAVKREIPIRAGLQPIGDIHLYHYVTDYLEGKGNIKNVYLFSCLAVLILITSCINSMNLSIARSTGRSKEVGVRKVIGARKSNLIAQFTGESIVYSLLAFTGAVVLVELLLPYFNDWSGKQLDLDFSSNIYTLFSLIVVVLASGVFAGGYPAFYLSSIKPVRVFRSGTQLMKSKSLLRKILVVSQLMVSTGLIVIALLMQDQLNYVGNKHLGYDKENLIYFQMRGDFRKNYEAIKNELSQKPYITGITAGKPPIDRFISAFSIKVGERELSDEYQITSLPVDYDYLTTYGMELIEGRDFSRDLPNNFTNGFIVNEAAGQLISRESPLGKTVTFSSYNNDLEIANPSAPVVGVVKNFHFTSLHNIIEPIIMYLNPEELYTITLKVNAADIHTALGELEKLWYTYASEYPFEYHFVDETIADFYGSDKQLGDIFNAFSIMAVAISCLGLIGLIFYSAERRTKEIGVRKIFGASVRNIVFLLTRELALLVVIANMIAWPLAFVYIDKWLETFAYRKEISLFTFIYSGLLVLAICLFTVGFKVLKTARSNPVEAIRYE